MLLDDGVELLTAAANTLLRLPDIGHVPAIRAHAGGMVEASLRGTQPRRLEIADDPVVLRLPEIRRVECDNDRHRYLPGHVWMTVLPQAPDLCTVGEVRRITMRRWTEAIGASVGKGQA